jgi:hypothetical protein
MFLESTFARDKRPLEKGSSYLGVPGSGLPHKRGIPALGTGKKQTYTLYRRWIIQNGSGKVSYIVI